MGISLQLADEPLAAGVLDDQEARAGGHAHRQAEHGAVAPELINDVLGFGEGMAIKCDWMVSSNTPSHGGRRLPSPGRKMCKEYNQVYGGGTGEWHC